MAAQRGVVLQEKVRRLVHPPSGKPVLKPNRSLCLKDTVIPRNPWRGDSLCITELSVMMACWKENNFEDALCSNEIKSFYSCVEIARAAMKNKSTLTSRQGHVASKQAITLLKKYPNINFEI
ncbi:small ribosomal subunit protein mS37 [Aulostomus maculatus]